MCSAPDRAQPQPPGPLSSSCAFPASICNDNWQLHCCGWLDCSGFPPWPTRPHPAPNPCNPSLDECRLRRPPPRPATDNRCSRCAVLTWQAGSGTTEQDGGDDGTSNEMNAATAPHAATTNRAEQSPWCVAKHAQASVALPLPLSGPAAPEPARPPSPGSRSRRNLQAHAQRRARGPRTAHSVSCSVLCVACGHAWRVGVRARQASQASQQAAMGRRASARRLLGRACPQVSPRRQAAVVTFMLEPPPLKIYGCVRQRLHAPVVQRL